MTAAKPEISTGLYERIDRYLRDHHTMTLATFGSVAGEGEPGSGNAPHAASVFYAVDESMQLVFLSQPSSLHGRHIGDRAAAAATITEHYSDWELIQGVQVWGEARLLRGGARAAAFAMYVRRFPFVSDLLKRPHLASLARSVGVYRLQPRCLAFTDNTTGVFGREMLDLVE